MNWVTLLVILIAWPLLGLAVAYLFGRFIRGVEAPENAGDLAPPVVSYLRRDKRARTLRARTAAHIKSQRKAPNGHRLH
jgi:hypothetical protein